MGIERAGKSSGGWRADLERYFRSTWESNYARYLNWLIDQGEIARWEYEADTFEFPVKRGSRFYTPDFKVVNPDGTYEYHEIKGWMDAQSATKLKRMAKYYPEEVVVVIGKEEYQALKKWRKLIEDWE